MISFFWPPIRGARKTLAFLALTALAGAPALKWRPETIETLPAPALPKRMMLRKAFEAAFSASRRGDCATAAQIYEDIEAVEPGFPTIHAQIAYCKRQLGEFGEALTEAQAAVESAAIAGGREGLFRIAVAEYDLAAISYLAGDSKRAVEALNMAMEDGFPYSCEFRNDPDLTAMRNDAALGRLVLEIDKRATNRC